MVEILLLLLSVIFFALAGLNIVWTPRVSPLGVGLCLLALAQIVPLLE